MAGNKDITCYEGQTDCYYVSQNPWQVWGRWVLLAGLIVLILVFIFGSGWLMSLRRLRRGLPPVPGFSWMFHNPYKGQSGKELEASKDFEGGEVQYPYYQPSSDSNSEQAVRKA